MNSASRLRMKRTRKIHSDQKPRWLARKLCSRRRFNGEILMPRKRPAWIASLISDLPALEVDAGIDDGVHDVAADVHQQAEQREEIERAEHDRIVPVPRGLEAEEIGKASCRGRVGQYGEISG